MFISTLRLKLNENNLKSTGVHNGMGRKGGWGGPSSFIQNGSKLPKLVFGVVSGWGGLNIPRCVAY